MVMFSSRLPADQTINRLTRAIDERRASGRPFIDLTGSNPTRAGFEYPPHLLDALAGPGGLAYAPQPFGLQAAREAVADDYARRGIAVAADRIVLTASTSEAYSLLFKVLCDPGDEVLTPRPSYPLFEHLTRLDGVAARPYDLEYTDRWSIDSASLNAGVSPRMRAVLLVNPNNPTGSYATAEDIGAVSRLCAQHGVALIVDEVFGEYDLESEETSRRPHVVDREDALTFTLGGLSKSVGLPQVKLGWMVVGGPPHDVQTALARLELACDTYLSVSTPVQLAAGTLLTSGAGVRQQIRARTLSNYRRLTEQVSAVPACRLLRAEGGWSAVLQVPAILPEEDLVIDLLQSEGVLAHPGYFFDFPREAFLILSLLTPPDALVEGVSRILACFDSRVSAFTARNQEQTAGN
jgi:alanine-synthesizing transaminase